MFCLELVFIRYDVDTRGSYRHVSPMILRCRSASGYVDASGDWNHGQHLAEWRTRPQVGKLILTYCRYYVLSGKLPQLVQIALLTWCFVMLVTPYMWFRFCWWHCCDFAAVVVLMTSNNANMQMLISEMQREAADIGLRISNEKCELVYVGITSSDC